MTISGTKRAARWLAAGVLLAGTHFAFAQQVENSVTCNEAGEPIAIAYGDSSSGCGIAPATDLDRFVFNGTAGDLIDITVRSTNTNLDPHFELRDQVNAFVDEGQCINVGCTISKRIVLPSTSSYFIIINDVNGNETGNYELQLELITPPPQLATLDYDAPITDALGPATDMDHFSINVSAGTTLRLLARSINTNMDPTFELRDPANAVVINGAADGATCVNVGCVVDVTLTPAVSGVYNLVIYDNLRNEAGGYDLAVWCVTGACPNAPAALPIGFDAPLSETVSAALDGDFYSFTTNPGTLIGLTARSTNTNLDPTVEIRDAAGTLVINGATDGAQCLNVGCTFSIEFVAVSGGEYFILFHDGGTNEPGGYEIGLWCLLGDCNNDPSGEEDRFEAPVILHTAARTDNLSSAIDGDFFRFHGTAGTDLQLNARSINTNLDPTLVVRDPSGAVVINGAADGAQCTNVGCTFSVPLSPAVTGTYTMLFFDGANNEPGGYELGLWCLRGDCDSDGDGIGDGDISTLSYGDNIVESIGPAIDSDFYQFNADIGDEIRLSVLSTNTNLDPTIVVRDPSGAVIVDGVTDGASCVNVGCSFSITQMPTINGRYTVMIFDNVINEPGNYQLGLECLFSPGPDFQCDDLAPANCGDNCSAVANVDQRDTNGDGFGNACDPDLNNDGNVNFVDLGLMKSVFFSADPDADLTGDDGFVNFLDLGIMKSLFFGPPGPSCAAPNVP